MERAQYKYVAPPGAGGAEGEDARRYANRIKQHVAKALRSQAVQASGQLWADLQAVLEGQAIYVPHFFCGLSDMSILEALTADLQEAAAAPDDAGGGGAMINWSKHLKHEDPTFSATFRACVERMAQHFDVEVFATRLNFYRDGTDWKPFHHDSHAYGGRDVREDFTMGASFGASRELQFLHEPSSLVFGFPQANGDVFAFTTEVNSKFKHGVPRPKQAASRVGPRFSIIAWGRRRSINKYNGGTAEVGECKQHMGSKVPSSRQPRTDQPSRRNEVAMGMDEMASLVRQTHQLDMRGHGNGVAAKTYGNGFPDGTRCASRSRQPAEGQGAPRGQCTGQLLAVQAGKEAQAQLLPRLKRHLGEQYETFRDCSNDCQYGRISPAAYCLKARALFLADTSADGAALDLLKTTLQLMPNKRVREQVLLEYQKT